MASLLQFVFFIVVAGLGFITLVMALVSQLLDRRALPQPHDSESPEEPSQR